MVWCGEVWYGMVWYSVVKGALSRGFCCVQVNSVLKSLLSTFTRTQIAKLRGSYRMKFSKERKPQ